MFLEAAVCNQRIEKSDEISVLIRVEAAAEKRLEAFYPPRLFRISSK